ncbi:MAG TPA: tetratricopeptide repeat protein [Gammaproteobacteria bacterium]|nr:tetratricopeptide repeat protein [Gammaproteobacteria bacterium]
MSLVNQVLTDLEERRGGALSPTAQVTLAGLAAAERPAVLQESQPATRTALLLLLLFASALLAWRENVLQRLFHIPVFSAEKMIAVTKPSPPNAPIESTSGAGEGTPLRDSTDVQPQSPPLAAVPAAVDPTVADSGTSASTDVPELLQLAARKEDNGVALWLHLSSPVEYTLETDPKGGATLRLANVRLREGYLQAFDGDGLIHDVQVRHGDGGDVSVRFYLRPGVSTGKVEVTPADGGGYQLIVHCDNTGIAPLVAPTTPGPGVSPQRLADAPAHAAAKIHADQPKEPAPAPENKRGRPHKGASARADRADTASGGREMVESERPGDFRMIPHVPAPPDRKTELYQSAVSALRGGDRARALSLGRQAMDADPPAVAPRVLVATLLMEDRHAAEARAQLEAGLSQAPGNRDYKLLYARLLSETGEIGKAIDLLAHDAPAPASDPDYHALLAALMQRAGRHNDAIVSYRRLLSVQPQNGLWWMGLGISLSASGQRQQARDAFTHALTDQSLPGRLRQFLNDQLQQLQGAST